MTYPPKDYLLLQGRLSPAASQSTYTRLLGPSESQYLEFLSTASPEHSGTSEQSQFIVATLAQLYFSDYAPPPPPAPLTLPTGPLKPPRLLSSGPPAPPPTQYLSSEGSALTVSNNNGQVDVLSGTSKSGDVYALSLETAAGKGPGRQQNTQAVWVAARILITKNSVAPPVTKANDSPLVFGLGYCPTDDLATLFLTYQNIATDIIIDFGQLSLQTNGSVTGQATITRGLTYYGNTFSLQTESLSADATDPAMYLPTVAAFWPFLDRVEFFAPALELLASRTASNLPPLPRPMAPLAAMQANALVPSTTLADFIPQQTAWIGPALGPLIAEFVSPSESSALALKQAALWLGWVLVLGSGKANLDSALTAAYEAYQALVNRNDSGAPGGGIKILPAKPVSADLSPFQRALDSLFG